MLYKNLLTVAASAAIAQAEDVYLGVSSDNSEIDGKTLGFPHEGAGFNYFFLGSGDATSLTYSPENKTISYPLQSYETFYQYFSLDGNFVALSVGTPNGEVTFDDDNTLLFNGSSDNFYGCMNTSDPYRYSTMSYELMYFADEAPEDCIALTVVNLGSSGSSASSSASSGSPASSVVSSSAAASSSSMSQSTYNGAAATYGSAGVFAALAGVAAALI